MMCTTTLHCETTLHRHSYNCIPSLQATTSLKRGSQGQAIDYYRRSIGSNCRTRTGNIWNQYQEAALAALLFLLMIATLIPLTSCFSTETRLDYRRWRHRPLSSCSLDNLPFIMALQDGNLDIATNHQAILANIALFMHQRFQAAPPTNQADFALEDGPTSVPNSGAGPRKVISSTTADTAVDSNTTTWVAPSATLEVTTSSCLESCKVYAATTPARFEITTHSTLAAIILTTGITAIGPDEPTSSNADKAPIGRDLPLTTR